MKRRHPADEPSLFPEMDAAARRTKRADKKRRVFFATRRSASVIKTKLVVGYFDFFCGPGVYEDRTESIPVEIVRFVLKDERLRKIIMMLFEDKNPSYLDNLTETLQALDGFNSLVHAPKF
ncbi:MAG TPA: hypothetical protein VGI19_01450 [Candidatus Cybelea sp.]|jgi:hypothetical protein